MIKNTYTVISFGNYETKILIGNYVNKQIIPIYKSSFLTIDCFQDSILIDEELLLEILKKEFTKVPLDISLTNIIINIPIRGIEIYTNKVVEMPIGNKKLSYEDVIELTEMTANNIPSGKFKLNEKVIYWKINGNEVKEIKGDVEIDTISWKINSYYVNSNIVNKYTELMKNFKCTPNLITCDSLVMNELFKNKERKYKILVNIGHLKSSFDKYENDVLIDQKILDFGIRNLTSTISKKTFIDETKSIEILKIYKDLVSVDINLALINHFKEKYLEYSQTTIEEINGYIHEWIIQLSSFLNLYINEKEISVLGVDEIYFYSSMNILDEWFDKIKQCLDRRTEVFSLKPTVFGVHETKFCSLIASMLYLARKINNSK